MQKVEINGQSFGRLKLHNCTSLKIMTKEINLRNIIFGSPVRGTTAERGRLQVLSFGFRKIERISSVQQHILNKVKSFLAG
jgi:hypothetical protein